jgi:hypothetical protein
VGFDITGELLIIYSAFVQYLGKSEVVHQLFKDLKKVYDSVRREVLYSILTEFGIPSKLVKPLKMCQSETCSRVWVGKHQSDRFPVKNGLNQI